MRFTTTILVMALCISVVSSNPLPGGEGLQSQTLDRLVMVEAENDTALRSKRTIGILRQLFPEISQIVEQKVNMIVTELFRIFGPIFLQGALGKGGAAGGGGGGTNEGSGTTVTVKNPFEDDLGDDTISSKSGISEGDSKVQVDLATFPPDEEDLNTTTKASENSNTNTSIDNFITTTEDSS